MSFSDEVQRFVDEAKARVELVGGKCADAVFESVVHGSPVSGAPGQPDSGDERGYDLIASWERKRIGETEWLIGTKLHYAPWMEEMLMPSGKALTQRSSVGGPHSVKLTVAAWPQIVEHTVKQL